METFLIRALQLIMSLSILVVVHECGHFLFARMFKIKVEKFCLFFDPWFTLFKYKPKKSDTEYAIGWLPLGGYVKIAGMIDESMDTEQMKQPAQPWEFRAKPAWQRLMVMVAGVVFNFILALFIYSMILFAWGDTYIPVQQLPLGIQYNETAKQIGFRDGDLPVSADGVEIVRYDEMLRSIVDAEQVNVLRNGSLVTIDIPDDMMQRLLADSIRFSTLRYAFMVDSIVQNSPAVAAGLQIGDSIVALNGQSVPAYFDYTDMVDAIKERAATQPADSLNPREFILDYYRNGQRYTTTAVTDSAYLLGVVTNRSARYTPQVKIEYGFFESFPAGIKLGVNTLKGYVGDMKYLFSKEGAKQIGGFGTIGSIFPAQWNWHAFWYMTAFLSIILAFMNILPIPALDGGHVMFLLYEIIARRKPSDKFMEYAQVVGMLLLFGLLIWANFNDVLRFFF